MISYARRRKGRGNTYRGEVDIKQRNASKRGNITKEGDAGQGIIITSIVLGVLCKMRGRVEVTH